MVSYNFQNIYWYMSVSNLGIVCLKNSIYSGYSYKPISQTVHEKIYVQITQSNEANTCTKTNQNCMI
jgi:hypothetical protein